MIILPLAVRIYDPCLGAQETDALEGGPTEGCVRLLTVYAEAERNWHIVTREAETQALVFVQSAQLRTRQNPSLIERLRREIRRDLNPDLSSVLAASDLAPQFAMPCQLVSSHRFRTIVAPYMAH